MGTCKALLLAGAAVIAPAAAVMAADLPPPPMIAPPVEVVDVGGWYLRGDVGVGFADDTDIRSTFDQGYNVPDFRVDRQYVDESAFIGAGVGYAFNSWLRFDATGEYRFNHQFHALESYDCSSFGCTDANGNNRAYDKYTGSIESGVFLVNGYADIGTWYGFTPFVGAGVGAAYHHLAGTTDYGIGGASDFGLGGYGRSASKEQWNFAWAAMAGIGYAIAPNVRLELGYRYLDMGSVTNNPIVCTAGCAGEVQKIHLASHDLRLGLRWLFADVAPEPVAYPLPPLIRKD